MRVIFIHGFGEQPGIFQNIAPAIGGEQVFIDLWDTLGNEKQEGLNTFNFSKQLAAQYNISSGDCVIGHSLGGWIAYYLKHHTGCRIVQLASWTNFDRVISPVRNGKIVYWLIRNRLYINKFQKWLFGISYNGLPSKPIYNEIFDNLIDGNRECAVSQLKLVFEPVPAIAVVPDLRIHALKDAVIKYPKEAFHEVSGDHFTLITNPAEVIQPIVTLLKQPG